MKKVCVFFAAIMTAATLLLLFACGNDDSRISERRDGYYYASGETGEVTAASGVRENPYALDGTVGALKPYTLITFVPREFNADSVYTYTASSGSSVYGGSLTAHPFASSFSAEIDAELGGQFKLTLYSNGGSETFELVRSRAEVGCAQAIETANRTLPKLSGEYEVRVRLIKNPIGGEGLCWYVLHAGKDERCGVLLDSQTGAVLAKK